MKSGLFVFFVLLLSHYSLLGQIPPNDDPCSTAPNPPLSLNAGGHTGTTCGARGFEDFNSDGSLADWQNVHPCNNATSEASVWYTYTPTDGDIGYELSVEGTTIVNQMTVQVYYGEDESAGCSQFTEEDLVTGSCTSLATNLRIGNCLSHGMYFIKVTTADDDCGEFDISVTASQEIDFANDCPTALGAFELNPFTNFGFDLINYECLISSLDFACPEPSAMQGCPEMEEMPTVWFKINTDEIATQMFTTVIPTGNWTPIWSVYTGPSCDSLTVIDLGGSPSCSNGDNTPDLHQTAVLCEESTWVAVTVDFTSLQTGIIDDGSFEICVATTVNSLICMGDVESSGCDEESLVMEVTGREFDLPLDSDGDGVAGPFCQGEELQVSVSFFYDASNSGADWLSGFVPNFGNGWDLGSFDFGANVPIGNGIDASYYQEGEECSPVLQESMPHLTTYTNSDGRLQICNGLCMSCPTSLGMSVGDILPSGYFWVTEGASSCCGNDCSPSQGWGIGSTTTSVTWEFTIRTKVFDNFDDCFENRNLQISFQTFSHGVVGCWEDPSEECLIDEMMAGPLWEVNCATGINPQQAIQEICSGDEANLEFGIANGSSQTIVIEVEDNSNVSGEGTGSNGLTFASGFGTVNDVLINTSGTPQEVVYTAQADANGTFCNSSVEYKIVVYPELNVDFIQDFLIICEGQCINVTPTVTGGTGNYISYEWDTGELAQTIEVCVSAGEIQRTVLVTDDLGCSDEATVTVKTESNIMNQINLTICEGDSFMGYTETGIYTEMFTVADGCDSIVEINLEVQTTESNSQNISICEGDEVNINGTVYSMAGIYTDTTFSELGCPTLINTINIDLESILTISFDINICEGESFMGFNVSGVYSVELPAEVGCDTLLTLDLTVLPADHPDCLIDAVGDIETPIFMIYPNPTQGLLHMNSELSIADITVYDIAGRKISIEQTATIGNNQSVDVSSLDSGIYLLYIQFEDGSKLVKKVMKQ